jgi:HD-GYP domain-containing protein (c-di-GMP phosphodiesterase class II)
MSRALACADVGDALTAKRADRDPMSPGDARVDAQPLAA